MANISNDYGWLHDWTKKPNTQCTAVQNIKAERERERERKSEKANERQKERNQHRSGWKRIALVLAMTCLRFAGEMKIACPHTHTHTTSSSNSSHRHDRLQLQCSEWLLLVHRLATTVSASSSAALWRPPQTLPQQNHFCQQIVIQRAQWHFLHIFLAICFHFAYSLAWNDFPFIAVNTKLHHLYNLWKLIKERKVAVVHR